MLRRSFFQLICFLLLTGKSFSQSFELSSPRIEFDGTLVSIVYDIISDKQKDIFYTWVEIEKANGDKIYPKDLSGDIGYGIKGGLNKKITWDPVQDSVNLDEEEIFIEVKAEKYIKSFNKGSTILQSALLPGWGQSKIYSSPWYLSGIALYGMAAGGYLLNKKSGEDYELYKVELDAEKRADLFNRAQNELNYSTIMMYSAAGIWLANLIWTAMIPNSYKPLQHSNVSVNPVAGIEGNFLLSVRINF